MINRLSRLWMFFTMTEMKPMGLTSFDEFLFLLTVQKTEPIRKKDLIYMHFIEISSGILMIDRMVKKGLLDEKTDELDKRSRLVAITVKGKKVVIDGHKALDTVYSDLYGDMPESAMLVCLEQLGPLLDSTAKKWNNLKKFKPIVKDV
ncbi:MarR family winged helix-turn-helix transcriptional regulator [Mucilaginibacter gracilis]|nr:MarR family winged helix-turn-helix transcriptional regulator [Mucilaginibacter gracilis]